MAKGSQLFGVTDEQQYQKRSSCRIVHLRRFCCKVRMLPQTIASQVSYITSLRLLNSCKHIGNPFALFGQANNPLLRKWITFPHTIQTIKTLGSLNPHYFITSVLKGKSGK